MKISEVIEVLEIFKKEYGDIPVTYFPDDSYYDFHDVDCISVETWSGQYYKTPITTVFLS